MPCSTVKLPGGGVAIVCGPRRKQNLCSCRAYAKLQCDWPKEGGGTCDKPICRSCARSAGPDTDYCPFHRGEPTKTQEQLDMLGEIEADKVAKMLGVKR